MRSLEELRQCSHLPRRATDAWGCLAKQRSHLVRRGSLIIAPQSRHSARILKSHWPLCSAPAVRWQSKQQTERRSGLVGRPQFLQGGKLEAQVRFSSSSSWFSTRFAAAPLAKVADVTIGPVVSRDPWPVAVAAEQSAFERSWLRCDHGSALVRAAIISCTNAAAV